jgi:hypothetical protein
VPATPAVAEPPVLADEAHVRVSAQSGSLTQPGVTDNERRPKDVKVARDNEK